MRLALSEVVPPTCSEGESFWGEGGKASTDWRLWLLEVCLGCNKTGDILTKQVYEHITSSIAPGVHGHLDVKRAIALMLFGGVHKQTAEVRACRTWRLPFRDMNAEYYVAQQGAAGFRFAHEQHSSPCSWMAVP